MTAPAQIEARDERPHEHGGRAGWSERLSFAFFDSASGFGGIARVEHRPVDKRAEGTLSVFLPGGAIATVFAREPIADAGGSSVARIHLDPHEALARWRIRCKDVALIFPNATAGGLPRTGERTGAAAPIDLELTFATWMPPHGTIDRQTEVDELNFVRTISTGHFEQAGRFHGKIRIGGTQTAFEGTGVRDKTWGPVDPTAQHSSQWFAAGFGPALAFSARTIPMGAKGLRAGWVLRNEGVRSISACHVETEYEGRALRTARIALTDESGDRYDVTAESICALPMREGKVRITQAMTRFGLGERETLGLSEYVETT
ncbi:MAG: DUF7064 domain-containing protein [Actinomycetota bacterium]